MSVSLIKQKTQALPGFKKCCKSGLELYQTSFDQCIESTVFGDRFDRFARKAKFYIMTKLRNPNSFILKIGRNFTLHYFGDVTTDTAFFLGETGTVDSSAGADLGSSNAANTGHNENFCVVAGREGWP
mgnify:CR=1 FL=1